MKTLKELGLALVCILVGIAVFQMDQETWYPIVGGFLVFCGAVIVVFSVIEIIRNQKK